jgi:hypothetical protein
LKFGINPALRAYQMLPEKVNLKVTHQNIWRYGEATPPYILAGTSQSPLLRHLQTGLFILIAVILHV